MILACCAVLLKLLVLYVAERWLADSIRTHPAPTPGERSKWAAILLLRIVLLALAWWLTALPPFHSGG
jgi:hypothetical protein